MYVTSLQNCQKTNETITFSDNHFCKICTWHTLNHSKRSQKSFITKTGYTYTRFKDKGGGAAPGRRWRRWLVGSSGSAGRRCRRRPGGSSSLSSSSSPAAKNRNWKRTKYLNIQYPKNILGLSLIHI